MSTEARPVYTMRSIATHVLEEWRAVGDPKPCRCGHEHYAREQWRDRERTRLAPQWTYCEEPTCTCRGRIEPRRDTGATT